MPYKWTPPPSHTTLEVGGKLYQPGDMVPISKADALHMMRYTANVFEGLEVETPAPPAMIPAQPQAAPAPRRD
jgi:hypothetical protein